MTTITLAQLSKQYDTASAVSDVSLSIDDGELLALVGPSGAGKTTVLRMVAGLTRPSSGDVLFDGNSVNDVAPEKRGAVMVFQSHALFPFMSVGDNVAYGLRRRGVPKAEIASRVLKMLAAVQLAGFENRWPDQLSGGQQQRVALARALVIRPNVLLLDEPLSNLDRALREELRHTIHTLREQFPVTTLFVTHDQAEAAAIADRIALLIDGRVRQVGRPRDFYDRPADVDVARFFGGVNFIQGEQTAAGVKTPVGTFKLDAPTGPVTLTIRPEAIQLVEPSAEAITGTVQSTIDLGTRVRCCIVASGQELFVDVSPAVAPAVGRRIGVVIASQNIHPITPPS